MGLVPQHGLQRSVQALIKRPGGEISAPVMIIAVSIGEEVAAKGRQLGPCCVQTSMKSLKVISQSPETSLEPQRRTRRAGRSWGKARLKHGCGNLDSAAGSHLDVKFWVLVEVVEELLVAVELHVPLARLREAEVVAQRHQKNRGTEETRLLAVLIQQEESSEGADRQPWAQPHVCRGRARPRPRSPLPDILLRDWLRRSFPRTAEPPPRQTLEVKLAADGRVGAAGVRHVVAVEGHHVTRDVAVGGGV